ncbi:MAG TPA: hypothetical protein VI893_04295, partial [Thermoplasmata archaeon]|nr:hypothetical protein [Thermoplasmata archaeon]
MPIQGLGVPKVVFTLALLTQAALVIPSGAEQIAGPDNEGGISGAPAPVFHSRAGSKLTIHTGFQNGGGESWRFIQEAKPGVVKIMDNFGDNGANVARIKQLSPGAIVVGRIYHVNEPGDGDPEQRARDWWDRNKARIRSAPGVDYWEGYNEFATGQESDNADKARWFARFEAERVRILAGEGLRACIGSFSVGTPPVNNPEHWKALYPAIDEA